MIKANDTRGIIEFKCRNRLQKKLNKISY